MPNLRRFKLKICPAIENILSIHADDAGTLRYFLAKFSILFPNPNFNGLGSFLIPNPNPIPNHDKKCQY